MVRNNFTRNTPRWNWFGLYTVFKPKPIVLTELTDHHQGLMSLRERRITDINFSALGVSRYQRSFKIGMEGNEIPNSNYIIRGVFLSDNILEVTQLLSPLQLVVMNKNSNEQGELKFLNRYSDMRYNRRVRRVFSPFSKLEGTVLGKPLVVQSSPWSNNAIEVLIDGKLTALVAHPIPTHQYLRKGRKSLPFIAYVAPGLTEETESLSLQAFQFNRLGYLLQDYYNGVSKKKK